MLRKAIAQRTLVGYLLVSLLFSFNLCAIESVSPENASVDQSSGHECSHHADNKSQKESGNEGQACCSNFLAVPTFLKSDFPPTLELKPALLLDTFAKTSLSFLRSSGDYLTYLLSGKSPPSVFLLAHFTHAPPVFL